MLDLDVISTFRVSVGPAAIQLLVFSIVLGVCFVSGKIVYNVFFHPLAHFPGSIWCAATPIPYATYILLGRHVAHIKEMHDRYGDIVRFSPDQISFASIQARQDIYALQPGHKNLPKDPPFYPMPVQGAHSIVSSPDNAHHAKFRRALSHAFSEKAIREQEPLITKYVDGLIDNLYQRATCSKDAIDMTSWYNFTTFDIVGDLSFGEPFGCVNSGEYHPWVSYILGVLRSGCYFLAIDAFPQIAKPLKSFTKNLLPSFRARKRSAHTANEKVNRRLAMQTDRADFLTYILRHQGKDTELSLAETQSTMALLVIAGSETTATLLTAATYHLLQNPEVLKRLCAEIRNSFKDEKEINIISVNKLKYQLAVLDEALRIHPPAPIGFGRRVPSGGDTIDGWSVPEGARVSTPTYTMSRHPQLWTDPEVFAPERWLDGPRFADDKLAASKPFSIGPRDCLGKNLAYAEMRLIMARMIWNFDLENSETSMNWPKTLKTWEVWEKGPLMVHLKPSGKRSARNEDP